MEKLDTVAHNSMKWLFKGSTIRECCEKELQIASSPHLLEQEEHCGVAKIHHFQCISHSSQREFFLRLGQVLKGHILKVKAANICGLLVDEATDVSVIEQLISFIQFANPEPGAPVVYFL